MNKPAKPPQASFLYSLRAVVWSFTGLRRKSDFDTDSARLNPVHVVIAALLAVACLIGILITIVKFVVP
ncbi:MULTISPECIES: DUF2970 domain-containing protein [unclassified Janthinobacterium]|uniref:DUF2970 domain-containing protein n=1 Tax=unclassified Janthinobacterium TaxID=2610881 RepID=UPI00161F27CD|nr:MULTISPECIES: DUF2970 domain-containing protein [unclassified Janthinobacterium]MBB5370533.1 hypothetical protein [Janthinobacterium sp. K2C7]MBB5383253.1 hypothetical protein [Janthinobacterium sp. K2Li3]MBB5388707.1 hypothetical protein [Janthinobacterium sp. K2E3]